MNNKDLQMLAVDPFTWVSETGAGGGVQEPAIRARARLQELVVQLRDDLPSVADPRARNLFETTANLLVALDEAFADAQARAR
ncbi:hypothetical protein ACGFSB_21840 [Streptomyces sp. NPDC048441]|uniref:hypothetical protein n=1 Tax=Streptomyces sp. NPDC048441 TaxID=3365552 RepID=UPI003719953B